MRARFLAAKRARIHTVGMANGEKRTDEQIQRKFPDRGTAPSNEVVVDPDAPKSPNVEHPE